MKIAIFYLFLSFFTTFTGIYSALSLNTYFENTLISSLFFYLFSGVSLMIGLFFFTLGIYDLRSNSIN